MTLWTAADAAAATGGRVTADWAADGISIDTRTLRPGDLFVALTAARDGHDFVARAFEKGAIASLVSRPVEGVHVLVADVPQALEALAVAARGVVSLVDRYGEERAMREPRWCIEHAAIDALG